MKFFISTGEVSGDLHISYLISAIKKKYKDIEFYGVGGEHCKKVGVKIIQNIDELSIMGFTEILKKYKFLKEKAHQYIEFIKKEKIEKVVLVDYGGFNLKFLELLKKEIPTVKVYYYIPPKVWIWGEKRVEKLRKADYIMVIFPWEVEFYKKHNINAIYFGNPFVDKYKVVERVGNKTLLLPGSRKQEIKSLTPIFKELIEKNSEKRYILKLSSKEHLNWIKELKLENLYNLEIEYEKNLIECVEKCKFAIAASGTVTLELALLGIPTVVVYKTSFINAFIAKHILKIGFVSLPNLTLNKEVYPELLQEKCNVNEIEKSLEYFENNGEKIENDITEVRKKLSGNNIIESYADFLIGEDLNEN